MLYLGRGGDFAGGDLLGGGGMTTAADTAFFIVGAVSLVLCRLRRRTTLKPSSWVAEHLGVSDWPVGVLAFSTAFKSCRVTVYVPQRPLNRVLPVRALH
jgi:hypothetical protein